MGVSVVNFKSSSAGADLVESLHRTGFAVVVNHQVPGQLIESVYREWDQFFDSPDKMKYTFSRERQDGYFARPARGPYGTTENCRDDKEFYHLFSWGRIPAEVSDAALRYKDAATCFATTLLRLVGEHTPAQVARHFPGPLHKLLVGGEENTLLRILRYPSFAEHPGATMRAGAHKDTNLITLLACGSEPGLQVLIEGVWEDLPWDPKSLVVNGGVMLDLLSRGYYPAGEHRVAPPLGGARQRARMAMPLFLHPADDVVLDGRQTASEFLTARLRMTYAATSRTTDWRLD